MIYPLRLGPLVTSVKTNKSKASWQQPKHEAHKSMVSPGLVEDTPATNQQSILDEDRESSTRIG
ncbi:unnamed protein product [Timema podura]|uniref:Uncharacterized protein n=1 Tax=Timema podura TaxID=61482 RepID=A0ABN7P7P9_TIMPD|nr:unnamed protein product [Timema podura]